MLYKVYYKTMTDDDMDYYHCCRIYTVLIGANFD